MGNGWDCSPDWTADCLPAVGIEELIIERDVCQGHLRLSFYRLVRYHSGLRVRSRLWTKMATVARDITTDMAFTREY